MLQIHVARCWYLGNFIFSKLSVNIEFQICIRLFHKSKQVDHHWVYFPLHSLINDLPGVYLQLYSVLSKAQRTTSSNVHITVMNTLKIGNGLMHRGLYLHLFLSQYWYWIWDYITIGLKKWKHNHWILKINYSGDDECLLHPDVGVWVSRGWNVGCCKKFFMWEMSNE